jgi:hypothetical protein
VEGWYHQLVVVEVVADGEHYRLLGRYRRKSASLRSGSAT